MKKRIWIGGIAALLVLLAGAAFVGGRLLNGQGLRLPGGQVLNLGFGKANTQHCDLTRVLAPELPGPPMLRRADLVRRQGNSLFIGVPLRNVTVTPGRTVSQSNSFDGPIVEVVVNRDTKLYQDVTFRSYTGPCGQVQQVLVPGKLDDIDDGTTFLVWGNQSGERITPSIVVYELPGGSK